MRYKNIVAMLLAAVLILGMVGGAIVSVIHDGTDTPTEEEAQENPTAEKEPPMVLLPSISNRPIPEQESLAETAEAELDVGKIERETNPVVVGGTVEYETKEKPTDEEP
jgi:hypothetical protein